MENEEEQNKQQSQSMSRRGIGLYAGFGLLAMAIIAVFANFLVIEKLVIADDATLTVQNLADSKGMFVGGIIGFIIIFLLDILVAWMLYRFFKPTHKMLSAVTAWSRIVYTGFLGFSITYLFTAFSNLNSDTISNEAVMGSINSFSDTWSMSFIFFGIHLLLLGALVFKAKIAKWIAAFIVIAGLGYLIDSVGALVSSEYALEIGVFTFIGEVIFMFWLLFKGGKENKKTQL